MIFPSEIRGRPNTMQPVKRRYTKIYMAQIMKWCKLARGTKKQRCKTKPGCT